MPLHISIQQQIECVRREIGHLDRVYSRLFDACDYEAAGDVMRDGLEMRAVLTTLELVNATARPPPTLG